MNIIHKTIIFSTLLLSACKTGNLNLVASIDSELKEASAIELVKGSDLLWTIEDAGNKNNIYGLDLKGNIIKDIDVDNAKNDDWEDLTSDTMGNIYIGDFGNNSKKRKTFTIYKISNIANETDETNADIIDFKMPKGVKSEDFEAFFLLNNAFYIFSKDNKKNVLLKVPNSIGKHTAELITEFKLDGKDNKVTSAAISPDKKTVVLLNHDKLWELTNFKGDNFFNGDITAHAFKHNSQKEGICFTNNNTVVISDEQKNSTGGNIYTFSLN